MFFFPPCRCINHWFCFDLCKFKNHFFPPRVLPAVWAPARAVTSRTLNTRVKIFRLLLEEKKKKNSALALVAVGNIYLWLTDQGVKVRLTTAWEAKTFELVPDWREFLQQEYSLLLFRWCNRERNVTQNGNGRRGLNLYMMWMRCKKKKDEGIDDPRLSSSNTGLIWLHQMAVQ